MLNIEFENFPNELIPVIQKLHDKYSMWYPKWVQTITYEYRHLKTDNEDTVAENYTSYPYRRIHINIFSTFLVTKDKYREEIFIHELFHSFSGVFTIPAYDIIEKLIEDEKFKHIIISELMERVEGFTQDLAYSLNNFINNNNENPKQEIKRQITTKPSQE